MSSGAHLVSCCAVGSSGHPRTVVRGASVLDYWPNSFLWTSKVRVISSIGFLSNTSWSAMNSPSTCSLICIIVAAVS